MPIEVRHEPAFEPLAAIAGKYGKYEYDKEQEDRWRQILASMPKGEREQRSKALNDSFRRMGLKETFEGMPEWAKFAAEDFARKEMLRITQQQQSEENKLRKAEIDASVSAAQARALPALLEQQGMQGVYGAQAQAVREATNQMERQQDQPELEYTPQQKAQKQSYTEAMNKIKGRTDWTDKEKQAAMSELQKLIDGIQPTQEPEPTVAQRLQKDTWADEGGNRWGYDKDGTPKLLYKNPPQDEINKLDFKEYANLRLSLYKSLTRTEETLEGKKEISPTPEQVETEFNRIMETWNTRQIDNLQAERIAKDMKEKARIRKEAGLGEEMAKMEYRTAEDVWQYDPVTKMLQGLNSGRLITVEQLGEMLKSPQGGIPQGTPAPQAPAQPTEQPTPEGAPPVEPTPEPTPEPTGQITPPATPQVPPDPKKQFWDAATATISPTKKNLTDEIFRAAIVENRLPDESTWSGLSNEEKRIIGLALMQLGMRPTKTRTLQQVSSRPTVGMAEAGIEFSKWEAKGAR